MEFLKDVGKSKVTVGLNKSL